MIGIAGPGTSARAGAWLPRQLTNRERFLKACRCEAVGYPPVWLMRQAGRVLPEYRALKERYSFLDLVRTPELATEVTLQPIRRFDFDAAILFSDILVVPEAMGQGYSFREAGGVGMDFSIRSRGDIERLDPRTVSDRLEYVAEAIRLTKPQLEGKTALIGFAGSPWTLATFMLEGGSCKNPRRGFELLEKNPAEFDLLLEKLTQAVVAFLRLQIEEGVDAIQIFDSHGGLLPGDRFAEGSGRWIKQIVNALKGTAPIIVFSKGTRDWKTLESLGADVLGIDHGTTLTEARVRLPSKIALQGNLDPGLLVSGDPQFVRAETTRLLREMQGRPGYIFNLGHGVPPAASLENVSTLISTIRNLA